MVTMCDIADGHCDVYVEVGRIARKEHRCMACRERIAPGQHYTVTRSLYDGRWQNWKHCDRCLEMLNAILKQDRYGDMAVDPALNCGTLWEDAFGDVPEDVQALAFAIPSDFATQDRESGDRGAT